MVTSQQLARRAQTLPLCLLSQATAGAAGNLEDFFWYQHNLFDFAERLVMIAGLAAATLYVHESLRAESGEFPEDPAFHDILRTILFDRGYTRGLACSLIQRAGLLGGRFRDIVTDDRPVLDFLRSRPDRPGNVVRAELNQPLEESLHELLDHLSFLGRFEFVPGKAEVQFAGEPVDPSPFMEWNGKHLRLFNRLSPTDRKIFFSYYTRDRQVDTFQAIGTVVLDRLSRLARLLSISPEIFDGTPHPSGAPLAQSVMPLFAESYGPMNRLAERLFIESKASTKRQLFLMPYFPNDAEAARLVGHHLTVTNCILKLCMTRGPVAVLEEYFGLEPEDIDDYVRWLVSDEARAQQLRDGIRDRAERRYETLSAFFRDLEHRRALDKYIEGYRAHLTAQLIARILGFRIIEHDIEEDIADYSDRFLAFSRYVQGEDPEPALIAGGLVQCGKALEQILAFICRFYEALRFYRPDARDGIDAEGVSEFQASDETAKKGLGGLIGALRRLSEDADIRRALQQWVGREGIWPENTHEAPMEALNAFNTWRNKGGVHRGKASVKEAADLVKGILGFVDWLSGAGHSNPDAWRIYPAILILNVVTTNSCGITSVHYGLRHPRSRPTENDHGITLYTAQPVSMESGCFYGLPHREKTALDLWVDPLLLPVGLFHKTTEGTE